MRVESPPSAARSYRFGNYEADFRRSILTCDGVRVRLPDQSFLVLRILLERPGDLVTREELRQIIWPAGTHVEFEGSLNAILKRLRAALNDDPDRPIFIETVPRQGYRFIAPVTCFEDSRFVAAAASPATSASRVTISAAPLESKYSPRFDVWLAVAALAIIFAVAAFAIFRWKSPVRSAAVAVAPPMQPVEIRKSLAVLGFTNTTGRNEDAWLGTALSEMLSTELSAGDRLRLISGEEVAHLRDTAPWPQVGALAPSTASRLGSALSSDVLLLGSYTLVGASRPRQIRLDLRLQNASTGQILFESADTGSEDALFQLVTHAGDRLRDHLGVPLLGESDTLSVLASVPANEEASRFYALGLSRLRAFDALGSSELFQQAVKADPKYPLAHSMLAAAWQTLGYGARAKSEAKLALDLSEGLPRTSRLQIEGQYYETLGENDKAASVYRSLFAYFPDCLDCGLQLAGVQTQSGHVPDALETIAALRKLPPAESNDPRIDFAEQWAVSTYDRPKQFELLERASLKASERGQKMLYARAKSAECTNLHVVGKLQESMAACDEAARVFEAIGDQRGYAGTLLLKAARQSDGGNRELALRTETQALQIARKLGGAEMIGATLNAMGMANGGLGHLDEAARLLRESRKAYEESGSASGISAATINLADVHMVSGHFQLARQAYESGLEIANSISVARGCYALYSLASLDWKMGDLASAEVRIPKAIAACTEQGIARHTGSAYAISSDIRKVKGDLPGARADCSKAIDIFTKAGSADLIDWVKGSLALIDLEDNRLPEAEAALRQALDEALKEKDNDGASWNASYLSRDLQAQGKLDEARKVLESARRLIHPDTDKYVRALFVIQDQRLKAKPASGQPASQQSLASAHDELKRQSADLEKLDFKFAVWESDLAAGEIDLSLNPQRAREQLSSLSAETRQRGYELYARKADRLLAQLPPKQ